MLDDSDLGMDGWMMIRDNEMREKEDVYFAEGALAYTA